MARYASPIAGCCGIASYSQVMQSPSAGRPSLAAIVGPESHPSRLLRLEVEIIFTRLQFCNSLIDRANAPPYGLERSGRSRRINVRW